MRARRHAWTITLALSAFVATGAPAERQRNTPRLCERIALGAHATSSNLLTRAAIALSSRLMRLNPQIEHGALLYRAPDGSIRAGSIAIGRRDTVDLPVEPRPGETIAGALHTHAHYAWHTGNQLRLSREDIDLGTALLALPQAERGLKLYIVDVSSATLAGYAPDRRCG